MSRLLCQRHRNHSRARSPAPPPRFEPLRERSRSHLALFENVDSGSHRQYPHRQTEHHNALGYLRRSFFALSTPHCDRVGDRDDDDDGSEDEVDDNNNSQWALHKQHRHADQTMERSTNCQRSRIDRNESSAIFAVLGHGDEYSQRPQQQRQQRRPYSRESSKSMTMPAKFMPHASSTFIATTTNGSSNSNTSPASEEIEFDFGGEVEEEEDDNEDVDEVDFMKIAGRRSGDGGGGRQPTKTCPRDRLVASSPRPRSSTSLSTSFYDHDGQDYDRSHYTSTTNIPTSASSFSTPTRARRCLSQSRLEKVGGKGEDDDVDEQEEHRLQQQRQRQTQQKAQCQPQQQQHTKKKKERLPTGEDEEERKAKTVDKPIKGREYYNDLNNNINTNADAARHWADHNWPPPTLLYAPASNSSSRQFDQQQYFGSPFRPNQHRRPNRIYSNFHFNNSSVFEVNKCDNNNNNRRSMSESPVSKLSSSASLARQVQFERLRQQRRPGGQSSAN